MRLHLPLLVALLSVLLIGCYAEWDAPSCSVPSDCPAGYTRCYGGVCLQAPLAGVDKAPLGTDLGFDTVDDAGGAPADIATADDAPTIDVDVASPDVASDASTDAGPDVLAPCTPGAADGCCPGGLVHLELDPDCTAWERTDFAFTAAEPPAVDVERGRVVLGVVDAAGDAAVYVLGLADGKAAAPAEVIGPGEAPCPLLLSDGRVVVVHTGGVRLLPLGGEPWAAELSVSGAAGCPALLTPLGGGAATVVVASSTGTVTGINVNTGLIRWSKQVPGQPSLLPPVVRNGVIVVATADGRLVRLDPTLVDVAGDKWEVAIAELPLPGPPLLPPVATSGSSVLVAVSTDGGPALASAAFEALGWADGSPDSEPLGEAPLPGSEPTLTEAGDVLLVHTTGLTAHPAGPVDVAPCEGHPRTSAVALAGGRVLLGTTRGAAALLGKNTAWCYDTGSTLLQAPGPIPDHGVLLVAPGLISLVRAPEALAPSLWPRPRHDLGNTAAVSL